MSLLRRLAVLVVVLMTIGMIAPRLGASSLLNFYSILKLRKASILGERENGAPALSYPISMGNSDLLRLAQQYDEANTGVRRAFVQELLAVGNLDQALTLINSSQDYSCSVAEGRPECWLLQACLLAREGQDDAAIRSWRLGVDLAVWRWPTEQLEPTLVSGIYMYRILVEHHPDRVDWRLLLMRLLWQLGRQDEAQAEATVLLDHSSQSLAGDVRAQVLLVLAQSKEARGDALGALEVFHKALDEDPKLALGYVCLSSLHESLGQIDQAQIFANRLANLLPQRSLVPRFQDTTWGAHLLGYDVAPQTVGEAPLLDLVLYWRLPENQVPRGPGWVRAGDHWLQFVRLPNLAMNAGFEQDDWVGEGIPTRYVIPNWMYVSKSNSEQGLFLVQRGDLVSRVFRQRMSGDTKSGDYPLAVEFPPMRVQPGECFMFDANIGGSGRGNATLWWQDKNQDYVAHDNILSLRRDADPAMRCVPSGASWMHFVLLLYEGEIEWDDVVIVKLPTLQ